MKYKHLFGPVPSRRLGISLGVDLVPFKTCTFDCVYCECGATTVHTMERKEYVNTEEVLAEIDAYLSTNPKLDYITFSGAGEPTLHKGLGKIVCFIKNNFPQYNCALITNGSLLNDAKLRQEILPVDLIIPSLDAASMKIMNAINRPCPGIAVQNIIDGLVALGEEYTGELWMEIFIVPGYNDTDEELSLLHDALQNIKAKKIQLNSLDRPGTESWVPVASSDTTKRVLAAFSDLPVECIGAFAKRKEIESYHDDLESEICATIARRPCTSMDLADALGTHINEINKYIQQLLEQGKIVSDRQERGLFYSIAKNQRSEQ